jgi:hypothetical protein
MSTVIERFIFADTEVLWTLLGNSQVTLGPYDYNADPGYLVGYTIKGTKLEIKQSKKYPIWSLYDIQFNYNTKSLVEIPVRVFDNPDLPPEHAPGWIDLDREIEFA